VTSDSDQKTPSSECVASDLAEGLESCRAVLRDYRAKIGGRPAAANLNEDYLRQRLSSS
jgi:hypothetical protein